MSPFRSSDYGERIAEILALGGDGLRAMPLVGQGCSSAAAQETLERLDAAALFAPRRVVASDFAETVRSGLFLYFSCLEESHGISQQIASTTGSYWHGIMHRQEPDFGNAAYWFRRVKRHAVFLALREGAAGKTGFRIAETWDPFRFVDACEQVHRKDDPALRRRLEEIQLAEWQLLFDYSCRQAVGPQS